MTQPAPIATLAASHASATLVLGQVRARPAKTIKTQQAIITSMPMTNAKTRRCTDMALRRLPPRPDFAHARNATKLIRDILWRMRHDGCGGRPGRVELLTSIEGASGRPARRIVLFTNPMLRAAPIRRR